MRVIVQFSITKSNSKKHIEIANSWNVSHTSYGLMPTSNIVEVKPEFLIFVAMCLVVTISNFLSFCNTTVPISGRVSRCGQFLISRCVRFDNVHIRNGPLLYREVRIITKPMWDNNLENLTCPLTCGPE